MKILYWDIETAPLVSAHWGLFRQNILYENIIQDWYMICAAWKWEGSREIKTASVLQGKKKQGSITGSVYTDDKPIVKALHKVLSEADAIVAHNGDHFDLRCNILNICI